MAIYQRHKKAMATQSIDYLKEHATWARDSRCTRGSRESENPQDLSARS
jgi:hypothetical protein